MVPVVECCVLAYYLQIEGELDDQSFQAVCFESQHACFMFVDYANIQNWIRAAHGTSGRPIKISAEYDSVVYSCWCTV